MNGAGVLDTEKRYDEILSKLHPLKSKTTESWIYASGFEIILVVWIKFIIFASPLEAMLFYLRLSRWS